MSGHSSSAARIGLRLVEGGRPAASPADEVVVVRNATRGERNEPWTLRVTAAVHALDHAAAERGIDFELALRIAVEGRLVAGDLAALGMATDVLDRAAASARVDIAVDATDAAYLRRLHTDVTRPRRDLDGMVIAGLPSRLSTRLLGVDLDALLSDADLEPARAWETAAVMAGRTMSEWAPLVALAALRG